MPRIELNSTGLQAATYQDQLAVLELEFRSGAIYRYFGVSEQTYQELLLAESKGAISTLTFAFAFLTPRSARRCRNPGCKRNEAAVNRSTAVNCHTKLALRNSPADRWAARTTHLWHSSIRD
jgi:hypothetical protein